MVINDWLFFKIKYTYLSSYRMMLLYETYSVSRFLVGTLYSMQKVRT